MSTYSQFNPIHGTTGADVLTGGLAFDLFTGGVGNDTINGGGGLNAAVFKGKASDYKITTSKGVVTITGPDGTDVMREVQFAIFSDEVKPLFDTTPIRVGFDEDFYLQSNPDVYDAVKAGTYTSGAQHYQRYGQFENRVFQATNGFDASYYADVHGDVAAAGIPAVRHYATYGAAEGRSTHLYFDAKYYLDVNPDVAAARLDPWTHFSNQGWKEGRNPSPFFDVDAYLTSNPDVAAAGVNPLVHYLNWGLGEGRHAYIDTNFMNIA